MSSAIRAFAVKKLRTELPHDAAVEVEKSIFKFAGNATSATYKNKLICLMVELRRPHDLRERIVSGTCRNVAFLSAAELWPGGPSCAAGVHLVEVANNKEMIEYTFQSRWGC